MAAANVDVNYSRFERNTGSNWVSYRVQTLDAMFYYEASGILDGTELEPAIVVGDAATVIANVSWRIRNRNAYGYLSFTQTPESAPYVSEVPVGNTPLYWARLQTQHFTGTGPGALNLVDRTVGARLTGTVASYISELQTLRRELRDLEVQLAAAPVPVGGVAQTLADVLVTSTMLRGLTREFQVTVDRLHSTPNLTMTIATESVLARDEYLKYEREQYGRQSGKAFLASSEAGSIFCTFSGCRRPGHLEENCFIKFPALREATNSARRAAVADKGKAKYAFSSEDNDFEVRGDVFGAYSAVMLEGDDRLDDDDLLDLDDDDLPDLIENLTNGEEASPEVEMSPLAGTALFSASTEETGQYLEGILDSGASLIFVSSIIPVENFVPSTTKSVHTANGTITNTTGRGTIDNIPVHDGPFPTNLISVRALLRAEVASNYSEDPNLTVGKTGERYGSVSNTGESRYVATISIAKHNDVLEAIPPADFVGMEVGSNMSSEESKPHTGLAVWLGTGAAHVSPHPGENRGASKGRQWDRWEHQCPLHVYTPYDGKNRGASMHTSEDAGLVEEGEELLRGLYDLDG